MTILFEHNRLSITTSAPLSHKTVDQKTIMVAINAPIKEYTELKLKGNILSDKLFHVKWYQEKEIQPLKTEQKTPNLMFWK